MSKIIDIVLIILITIALFLAVRYHCVIQRGNSAIGGEIFILILPLVFYEGYRAVQDLIKVIKKKGE